MYICTIQYTFEKHTLPGKFTKKKDFNKCTDKLCIFKYVCDSIFVSFKIELNFLLLSLYKKQINRVMAILNILSYYK